MKLLSWNVAGRQRGALAAQLEKVLGQQADVVALQEITAKTYAPWVEGLVGAGYSLASSIDLLAIPYPEPIKRKNFNLVATRGRIAPLPGLTWPDAEEARVAFPEKYVAALVECDDLQVEVHNAHLPPGSALCTADLTVSIGPSIAFLHGPAFFLDRPWGRGAGQVRSSRRRPAGLGGSCAGRRFPGSCAARRFPQPRSARPGRPSLPGRIPHKVALWPERLLLARPHGFWSAPIRRRPFPVGPDEST